MLTIRRLEVTDHERVRAHLSHCWRETYTKVVGAEQVEEMILSLREPDLGMLASDGVALVAVETATEPGSQIQNEYIIGTIMAAERHGTAYIWGMYVSPDKKRQGIGRKLIKEMDSLLVSARELSVMVLQASLEAQGFYRELGFAPTASVQHELTVGNRLPATTMVSNSRSYLTLP